MNGLVFHRPLTFKYSALRLILKKVNRQRLFGRMNFIVLNRDWCMITKYSWYFMLLWRYWHWINYWSSKYIFSDFCNCIKNKIKHKKSQTVIRVFELLFLKYEGTYSLKAPLQVYLFLKYEVLDLSDFFIKLIIWRRFSIVLFCSFI